MIRGNNALDAGEAAVDAKGTCTAEDYWNLPEGHRAELIDGELWDMTSPNRAHQRLAGEMFRAVSDYIDSHKLPCEADIAPFAVNLFANDTTFVEPDVLVVCDKGKLSDRGCEGAPDFVVAVVSPSDARRDYVVKLNLYSTAGVREYWIVDPQLRRTMVYRYEEDAAPQILPFDLPVESGICPGFAVVMAELV